MLFLNMVCLTLALAISVSVPPAMTRRSHRHRRRRWPSWISHLVNKENNNNNNNNNQQPVAFGFGETTYEDGLHVTGADNV
jgi:hypothetical protein